MPFAYRVSGWNRRRKWELFLREMSPSPEHRVLDIGYSDREYSATDNFIEKHYPYRDHITAIGVDEPIEFLERYPDVKVLQYDGTTFPFDDLEFDIGWSNAVLEHVGSHAGRTEAQITFMKETARVCRRFFVTTPNRWFPVEVHTRTPLLHWLPKAWFDRYLRARGNDWAAGNYMDLLSYGQLRSILEAAGVGDYRIVRNRLLGMTMDFVVISGP